MNPPKSPATAGTGRAAGPGGTVDVFLLATAAVPAAEVARAALLLDAAERARAAAFRRAGDGRDFILAHALLRRALTAAAGGAVAPAAWRFTAGPGGKPGLAGPGPSFNLSHGRGLVAAAVGRAGAIGVDVEAWGPGRPEDLAATVLTADEQADLAACPPADRGRRFLRYWTLKEALLKATGDALAIDPARFGVRLDPPGLIAGGAYPPDPAAWAFAAHALPEGPAAVAVPAGARVTWRTGWPD